MHVLSRPFLLPCVVAQCSVARAYLGVAEDERAPPECAGHEGQEDGVPVLVRGPAHAHELLGYQREGREVRSCACFTYMKAEGVRWVGGYEALRTRERMVCRWVVDTWEIEWLNVNVNELGGGTSKREEGG